MKKTYVELSRYIIQQFPDLKPADISGNMDEPPEFWVVASQITALLQIVGMAFVVLGDSLLEMIGLSKEQQPKWLESAKENRMAVFFGLFFLNNFASSHLSTGAFEVAYNGEVVYSKLATGRMPTVKDVIYGIESVRSAYHTAQGQLPGI